MIVDFFKSQMETSLKKTLSFNTYFSPWFVFILKTSQLFWPQTEQLLCKHTQKKTNHYNESIWLPVAQVGGSAARTSELWGEKQSLEQRVEVAGSSLIFNAAQIASPTGWRRLLAPLGSSFFGGGRGESLILLLLKKVSKHVESGFISSVFSQ